MLSYHASGRQAVRCFARMNASRHVSLESTRVQHLQGIRLLSSNSGIFDRFRGSMEDRNKRKQAEKYAVQLEKMANSEVWTLSNFLTEIEESIPSGWKSKIPFAGNTQQIKAAQDTKKAIQAMLNEVGGESTVQDLENIGRKEKLKISLTSDVSVEDINILIQQFRGTEIMHQVLRKQKLSGKPLPTDEQGMKALFQSEASKVLSKGQKRSLKESQMKKGGRGAGRIRR